MISNGNLIGDGSWNLQINILDQNMNFLIRVKNDFCIREVILNLLKRLDSNINWSNHLLWWTKNKKWLNQNQKTLAQYSIQANDILQFINKFKTCIIQLPDLRIINYEADFSINCFTFVSILCRIIGIRYCEEWSLMRPLKKKNLKKIELKIIEIAKQNKYHERHQINFKSESKNNSEINSETKTKNEIFLSNIYFDDFSKSLKSINHELKGFLFKPKSYQDKAKQNNTWLNSSLSLYEQDINEFDLILLRYKFFNFFDLNPNIDQIRINQIYEQAHQSICSKQLNCTKKQLFSFAALRLQTNLHDFVNLELIPNRVNFTKNNIHQEIDDALTVLQLQLEGILSSECNLFKTRPAKQLDKNHIKYLKLNDYFPNGFFNKFKSKNREILRKQHEFSELSQTDAKLKYIQNWQEIFDFGKSLFIVRLEGNKKEHLLGICSDQIILMDLKSGRQIKFWKYKTLKSWNINWEIKQLQVDFEEETLRFYCLSADCKIVHEFIGGYIFMSIKSKTPNLMLDENLFLKLIRR